MTTQDLINTLKQGRPMSDRLVRDVVRELEGVVALREAVRPVVDLIEAIRISYPTSKWGGYHWAVGTTKVTSAQMDALAALVGEEGK